MIKYMAVLKFPDGYLLEADEEDYCDTYEEAEEYGLQMLGDYMVGAETLSWSNPGDYAYDEDLLHKVKIKVKKVNVSD